MNSTALDQVKFDYSLLGSEARRQVEDRTDAIHDLIRNTARNVFHIGGKLAEVRQMLEGNFKYWLEAEFSWSERTAYNFISVWAKFGTEANLENFAPSALYLLAAPSTPPEILEHAQRQAQRGERVTHAMVKSLLTEIKESPKADEPEPKRAPAEKRNVKPYFELPQIVEPQRINSAEDDCLYLSYQLIQAFECNDVPVNDHSVAWQLHKLADLIKANVPKVAPGKAILKKKT